jgi:hypothetical protein
VAPMVAPSKWGIPPGRTPFTGRIRDDASTCKVLPRSLVHCGRVEKWARHKKVQPEVRPERWTKNCRSSVKQWNMSRPWLGMLQKAPITMVKLGDGLYVYGIVLPTFVQP